MIQGEGARRGGLGVGAYLLLLAGLLGPLGVLGGGGIVVGQEGGEGWLGGPLALRLDQHLMDLAEQLLGDGVGEDDLAGLGDVCRRHFVDGRRGSGRLTKTGWMRQRKDVSSEGVSRDSGQSHGSPVWSCPQV
jgi:hypothetical protein